MLTGTDVKDRRGIVGGEAQGQVWQQQDEIHRRANTRAPLGLQSTGFEGSSKSPVSTRMAPAPPLWAELRGKAGQSSAHHLAAGSCITPFHLYTLQLKHLQKSAAIQASLAGSHGGQVCPAMGSKLSRFSSIATGSTSHLPAGLLGASPLFPRPRRSPWGTGGTALACNTGPGMGETAAVPWRWGRARAAPWAGGGCPFPGFSLEPCTFPAALSQRQARRKVCLAFSFPN